MPEIAFLRSIKMPALEQDCNAAFNILEWSHNNDHNLWNVFCLVQNRYTIIDGKDHRDKIIRYLKKFVMLFEGTQYLKDLIGTKSGGVLVGRLDTYDERINKERVWSISLSECENYLIRGNGVSVYKRAILICLKSNRSALNIEIEESEILDLENWE